MEEVIPFKGKNLSWIRDVNLLCKENNIYIMDNHVAALWCWMQEISSFEKYNILHVDAHYDTMYSRIDTWLKYLPDNFKDIDIHSYLAAKFYDDEFMDGYEIMQWDNYLPIFHRLFNENIHTYHFFTHKEGNLFEEMKYKLHEYPIPGLFNLLDYIFDESYSGNYEWIVNIDLDYFFQKIDGHDLTLKFISDEAIWFFFEKLKVLFSNGRIKVMTIAMSPECCGGWENSIKLLLSFTDRFNLKIDAFTTGGLNNYQQGGIELW